MYKGFSLPYISQTAVMVSCEVTIDVKTERDRLHYAPQSPGVHSAAESQRHSEPFPIRVEYGTKNGNEHLGA